MEPDASSLTNTSAINKTHKTHKNPASDHTDVRYKMVNLKCSVMNNDWGRRGGESNVARLYALNMGVRIEMDKPYAELWMGTHENGPSYVIVTHEKAPSDTLDHQKVVANGGALTLASWIKQNPTVLGAKVLAKYGPNLPFLFKVLSVEKALSIQAHPDKELAAILHRKQPDIYKDDNHKPEMALALSDFEALCGFVSLEELKGVIHSVPEIEEVVGRACAQAVLETNELDGEEKIKEALRSLFSKIMSTSKNVISQAVSRLSSRLNMKNEGRGLTEKEKLVLRLEQQYPADVGVIAAFLLNYIKLRAGEALYLGANEPHAYIYGECIECMATSDNVVRGGLTPKYIDVQTLCSMLTYKQGLPDILQGEAVNSYIARYYPPFEEFEIDRCYLPEETETVFPSVRSPSIFLVLKGKGTMSTIASREIIVEGDVLFTPADTEVSVSTKSGLTSDNLICSGLTLYRTGVNSKLL